MKKFLLIISLLFLALVNNSTAQEYNFTTYLNLHIQNPSSGYSGTLPITATFTKCVGHVYMLINYDRASFVPTHYTYNGVKYPIQQIKHLNPKPEVVCVTFTADVVHIGSICFKRKLECVQEAISCYDLGYTIADPKDAAPYWNNFFFTVRIYEVESITRQDHRLETKLREMLEAKKKEEEEKKKEEENKDKKEETEKEETKEKDDFWQLCKSWNNLSVKQHSMPNKL
jgi:hypothetical protein